MQLQGEETYADLLFELTVTDLSFILIEFEFCVCCANTNDCLTKSKDRRKVMIFNPDKIKIFVKIWSKI